MSFTQHLRQIADPLWQEERIHPLVVGIGNGTLPLNIFRHYMKQDYLFLIEFSRVIALATAKAENLSTMSWFSNLLDETLNTEMDLHVSFCADFGIDKEDLLQTTMSPTTYEYTTHLMNTAQKGNAVEIATAILPCSWGYSEIGKHLYKSGLPDHAPLHKRWIEMYNSEEYADLATWIREYIDIEAEQMHSVSLHKLQSIFLISSIYEGRFWESAYIMEEWDDASGHLII